MSEVWLPGASGPLDDLIARVHLRIEEFVARHGTQAVVEIELREGARTAVRSLSAEPGSGFVTFRPYREDGAEEEWIVPIGTVARITLRAAAEREPFGFSIAEP